MRLHNSFTSFVTWCFRMSKRLFGDIKLRCTSYYFLCPKKKTQNIRRLPEKFYNYSKIPAKYWIGDLRILQLKYICDVTLRERSTHTNSGFLIQRVSLCFPLQSVWTTRLYTWCPSPATANKSVLLLWPTRPLGTPAFQEPGSTSVWSILVVGLSSFTRRNYGPRINQRDGFKHRNRLPWYGSLTSRLFLFFHLIHYVAVNILSFPTVHCYLLSQPSAVLITPNNTVAENNRLWAQIFCAKAGILLNFLRLAQMPVRSCSGIVYFSEFDNSLLLVSAGSVYHKTMCVNLVDR